MSPRPAQIAFVLLALAAVLAADDDAPAPFQFILLKNGQTIEAEFQPEGDRVLLRMGNGASLRVDSVEIAFRAGTLEQLYAFQRAGVPPRDVTATLGLADWCLRMGLLDQAREQLGLATLLAPSDRRLPNLERRLAQHARTGRPAALPNHDNPPARVVSSKQVSQELASLPAETIQQFTSSIQPLLLNRCGSNGCHGPTAKSGFTLIRTAAGRPIPQRLTQRNLYNVLNFLDQEDVLASRLMAAPGSPHGKLQGGVLAGRENRQFAEFLAWCQRARQEVPDSVPSTPTQLRAPPILAQPQPETAPGVNADPPHPLKSHDNPPASQDPFDPEPFNRRFHGPSRSTPGL